MRNYEYLIMRMKFGLVLLVILTIVSLFGCMKKPIDEDQVNCWKCNIHREEIKNDPDGTVYTEYGDTKYEVCGTDDEIKKNHLFKKVEGNNWFEYTTCQMKR